MRGRKLVTRLNAITEALEARGIGSWCDCPNEESINTKRLLASALLHHSDSGYSGRSVEDIAAEDKAFSSFIASIDETIATCSEHRPRPTRKPNVDPGFIWLRLIPELAEAFEQEIVSAGKTAFSGNGDLKASRFSMSEYA